MEDGNAGRRVERPLARLPRNPGRPGSRDTWSWLGSARDALDDLAVPDLPVAMPEAGWHLDPTHLHAARYWDGAMWTDKVVDRNRALSSHHVGLAYPPPGLSRSPAPPAPRALKLVVDESRDADAEIDAPLPDAAAKRAKRRLRSSRPPEPEAGSASDPYAILVMESLADGNPYAEVSVDHAEALALAASVLQRACERAGFDWRATDMTIDAAIDALPVDLAAATVKVMREVYETAGDDENTAWTTAKLREIQALELAHRTLQSLVNSRFRDEFIAKASDSGVSSELSSNFLDRFVTVEIPTLGTLRTSHPEVAPPD